MTAKKEVWRPTSPEIHMSGRGLAAILVIYTGESFAPEVNLREQSVNKVAHSGFETQRRRHQMSKTGVSVAPHVNIRPTKINF